MTVALVNTDQKELIAASAVIDNVSPFAKGIGTTCFDTALHVVEVDNDGPAWIVGVGGWNSVGAPSGGAFGIYGSKAILECFFNWSLHGVQADLTVALNIDVCI